MPDWLMIAIPAGLFVAVIAAFLWGLCEAASQADDAIERDRERDHLATVLPFPDERRTRRDSRNGLGGAA